MVKSNKNNKYELLFNLANKYEVLNENTITRKVVNSIENRVINAKSLEKKTVFLDELIALRQIGYEESTSHLNSALFDTLGKIFYPTENKSSWHSNKVKIPLKNFRIVKTLMELYNVKQVPQFKELLNDAKYKITL